MTTENMSPEEMEMAAAMEVEAAPAPEAAPVEAVPGAPVAPEPKEEEPSQLQSQIEAIEASGSETVPIEQVRELIGSVKEMFGTHFDGKGGANPELFGELGELAKFINNAKKELQEVRSSQIADKEIPDASNQLDAIIKMTEMATGRIMDECERVQSVHELIRDRLLAIDPPVDPDAIAGVDDALNDAGVSVTHIYEACNFQDITGQRIQKVVNALQEVERQVLRMVVVFGLAQHEDNLDEAKVEEFQQEADLLNGPSMPGQGLDQDDIDDILSTLL